MQGKRYIITTVLLTVLLLAVMLSQAAIGNIDKVVTSNVPLAPGIEDLGQPVPGADNIWDETTWLDTKERYRIYGVTTGLKRRLFFYDPCTGDFTILGDPELQWYSIEASRIRPTGKRFIYAGTAGNAYLSRYDPDNPRWEPGWSKSSNPLHLGHPIPGPVDDNAIVFDLVETTDGYICGGTGCDGWHLSDEDTYIFTYDPRKPWELGKNPYFSRFPVSGQNAVTRVTAGRNGMMYGLTMPPLGGQRAYFFGYKASDNQITFKLELPASPEGGTGALTTGADGKIYISIYKDLYVFDPDMSLMDTADAGGQIPVGGVIWRMVTGPDGRIYMGTGQGEFVTYDPRKPWKPGYKPGDNPHNLGQAVQGETRIRALAAGTDGMIHGGTAWSAHFFQFTPVIDLGQPVPGANNLWDLTTWIDRWTHRIYGVTTGLKRRLFFYDPYTGGFTILKDPGLQWYSIEASRIRPTGKRFIYAGTAGNAYLSRYDPDNPRWEPGWSKSSNPLHLGHPIPGPVDDNAIVFDLVETTDGYICGGTGCDGWHLSDEDTYIFTYDPRKPWELGKNPYFSRFPVSGQNAVTRVTAGRNGMMYGLTMPPLGGQRAYFFGYKASDNQITFKLELPASPEGGTGALTTGADGKIYISIYKDLYVFDPDMSLMDTADAGGQIPVGGVIWRMVTGPDGRIYMGTGQGEFVTYDPRELWKPGYGLGRNPRNWGQAVQGETRVRSLAAGTDNIIYMGTAWHAHFAEYIPVPKRHIMPQISVDPLTQEAGAETQAAKKQSCSGSKPAVLATKTCFPNPFNPDTWIPYEITRNVDNVTVCIYSVSGQLVRTLHLGGKEPGLYMKTDSAAYWDGKDESGEPVGSGIYFYQIRAGDSTVTRKMVVVK